MLDYWATGVGGETATWQRERVRPVKPLRLDGGGL
jgi:hypothetical protein